MKEKFLITLATGNTGFQATIALLKAGKKVRIFVRSRNAKALELEKLGAEIAIGEFNNYEQLRAALKDITGVYYCYPIKKGMVEDVKTFIELATETGLKTLVFMGQWLAEFPDQKSLLTNNIKATYDILKKSGLNVVYYIPGFFAENVVALTEGIIQMGIMPSPFGEGKCPWISAADQGRVVAALLINPEPYYGKKVHPTGPESISAKEMADIYSKILRRKIKLMPVSDDMFLKAVLAASKEFGYNEFVAIQTVFYMQEFRLNRFAEGGPTNIVKELTGNEPEDFETIARQFINSSPYKERSFKNKVVAMIKFMKLLFTRLPNKKELEELNK